MSVQPTLEERVRELEEAVLTLSVMVAKLSNARTKHNELASPVWPMEEGEPENSRS